MRLIIDATQWDKISFNLVELKKNYTYPGRTEQLLDKLISFLKKNKVNLNNLTAIGVYTGAGSFTNLRIATVIANTLGHLLKIPLYQFSVESQPDWSPKNKLKIIQPNYGRQPNITKPGS